MKPIFRFTFALASVVVASFVALAPQAATAQSRRPAPPEITSFQVEQSDLIAPGSDLSFTLEGTPRSQASVRLSGISKVITLREVERGVYEGGYTVSRRDRFAQRPVARATLRARGASVVADQTLSVAGPPVVVAPPPPVVVAPAPPPAAPPVALAIERFRVMPVARIEPGAELRFVLIGSPGARGSFTIDGVVQNVAMAEVRPGHYEGAYTIRRNDNFPPSLSIVGTLELRGQVMRTPLNQALLVDARPPTISNMAPMNNEIVTGGGPFSVSATFDDRGGVGVDAKSVKVVIDGQDVTRNASISPQFLTWRGDLRPGVHAVEVTAADIAGNSVRQSWSFNVAGPQTPLPAAVLPLQITSHSNNAQVSSGPIEVRGRTAPDAKVDMQVQAIASVAGLFGLNQQVANQTIRSDGAGNFGFSFQAQIPVPGTRYEVTVTATKDGVSRESKLVLFQQR
ncbi:MAG: Ig-like domain-containing protein [Bdellovibrionales bacterium]|nr:Ig-like domain-containing protein [Ramlibacter sp.]